ncbi:MAG: hypothetical protein AAGF12_14910 [Myxococcota bacterium]
MDASWRNRPRDTWSDEELHAALPALASESTSELRKAVQWAAADPDALVLIARGAATLGVDRWIAAYAVEPESWVAAVGGKATAARWKRSLDTLTRRSRTALRRVECSPAGVDVSTAVACSPRIFSSLKPLLATGWLAWRAEERVEVPAARRALLPVWDTDSTASRRSARRWFFDYLTRRIAMNHRWTEDDRTSLVAGLENGIAPRLTDAEFAAAMEALRRTRHAGLAIALLRQRKHATAHHRQTLGGALIEMGAYRDSLEVLTDRTRGTRVMRAHALIRTGRVPAGRRILRALGPSPDDENWALQNALVAIEGKQPRSEGLFDGLVRASSGRPQSLARAMYAEWLEVRADDVALDLYPRAIAELHALDDEVGTAYSEARYARTLARCGRRADAAEIAERAWTRARTLPGVVLRGLAAVACVESGIARTEALEATLRAAASAELRELATAAATIIGPGTGSPILALGRGTASLDGVLLSVPPRGPTWRILAHLCRLPPASIASTEELFRVGWPGERARPESLRRRVHTAVWALRRAGLRSALVTVDRNRYRLHARVISESEDSFGRDELSVRSF